MPQRNADLFWTCCVNKHKQALTDQFVTPDRNADIF